MASGIGASVTVLDLDLERLRWIDHTWGGRIRTLFSTSHTLAATVAESDLVVGAVLVPGAMAPRLVTEDHVRAMKPGTAIVDVLLAGPNEPEEVWALAQATQKRFGGPVDFDLRFAEDLRFEVVVR